MTDAKGNQKHRILVIDDNRAIHEDYRKILVPDSSVAALDSMEAELFGDESSGPEREFFEIDSAYQGQEGYEMVKAAAEGGQPYSMAFVDMRMPPGWDGIETIEKIWEVDPNLQVVICSAYSDHSWSEISQRLGNSDQLLILKKPFDNVEIIQMAHAMSQKTTLHRLESRLSELDDRVREQSAGDFANEEVAREKAELSELKSQLGDLIRFLKKMDNDLNIPIQDVRDNLGILRSGFEELFKLVQGYRDALEEMPDVISRRDIVAQFERLENSADFDYLRQRMPDTFKQLENALEHMGSSIETMQDLARKHANG